MEYVSISGPLTLSAERDADNTKVCMSSRLVWTTYKRYDDKTEFLLIGTRQQMNKVELLPLRVGTMDIEPVSSVRNLDVWFDPTLSMGTPIK